MATPTRQMRWETVGGQQEWKQTLIATRVWPPKEPREERMLIAKPRSGGGGGGMEKVTLNLGPAQAKKASIRLVSSSSSNAPNASPPAMVRDPEIVDLAAPVPLRSWKTRPPTRQAPPPPPPPKRMPSWRKHGVPSTASRQSEMSFGILDYYIHDAELDSRSPGSATVRAVDPAIERFDFGLDERERVRTPPHRYAGDRVEAISGAEEEDEMHLVPLSPRPFVEEGENRVVISSNENDNNKPTGMQHKKTYSLFPAVKDTNHRMVQVYDRPAVYPSPGAHVKVIGVQPRLVPGVEINNFNNKTPTATRHRADTIHTIPPSPAAAATKTPSTALPSPSYHPRNPSHTLSSPPYPTKTHNSTRLIPLRILSSSSTSTTNTVATNLTATTSRSSTSTSSPSSTSTHKPLLSNSRWSEDTALASPTTAAAVLGGGTRASWGSLLGIGGVGEGVYPDCFFEDDDEDGEGRPLRRGKGGRRRRGKGWRDWVCCGIA